MSKIYQLNDYIYCVPFTYNNNSYRICLNIENGNMFLQLIIDDDIIDIETDNIIDTIINDRGIY